MSGSLRAEIDGTGDQEVWVPPTCDVVSRDPDRPACRHCGFYGFHSRTQRCSSCGKRRFRLDVFDYPTAWAIQAAGLIAHTDSECSAVQSGGSLLCDCRGVLNAWNELRRERGIGLPSDEVPRIGSVLTEVDELERVPFRGVVVSDDGDVCRRVQDRDGVRWIELDGAQRIGVRSRTLIAVSPRWTFVWESTS